MPKRRIRQHKNPLSFQAPVAVPNWSEVFADPSLPLEVDVGCAHGDFLIARAQLEPDCNYVGLEIRQPMVDRVNGKLARAGLHNVRLVCCNANTSWEDLFRGLVLRRVYVHFPDPWFKKRHHKRRVVTPRFVDQVASSLPPGGEFRFMTDFEDYAVEVAAQFREDTRFENRYGAGAYAPREEGFPLTHREEWHSSQGDPVYRYVWLRRAAEEA